MRNLLLLPVAILFLVSCASDSPIRAYAGPARAENQIAQMIIPGAISLELIDGKEYSSPPDSSQPYTIELLPGKHTLVFKYQVLWGTSVSATLVESNLALFEENFQAGSTYHLQYKVPQDEFEAIEMRKRFQPGLLETQSGIKFISRLIKDPDSIKLPSVAATHSDTARASTEPVIDISKIQAQTNEATSSQKQPLPDAKTAVNENPVKHLKFWWLMSSEQERAEFSQWIKSVNESFSTEKPANNSKQEN